MTLAELEDKHEIGDKAIEFATKDKCLHLSPGDVFLDIGASQGSWSARALAQGVDVIMIDSHQRPIEFIDTARELGRESSVDSRLLNIGDGSLGSVSIDSLNILRVDFVKIDIEGNELAALRGMTETIKRCRPRIMTEVHLCYGVQLDTIKAAIDVFSDYSYKHSVINEQPNWYFHLLSEPA